MESTRHDQPVDRPCGRLERLATFPEQNPNPVVEFDYGGKPTYQNPVALEFFPDLQVAGSRHPLVRALRREIAAYRRGRRSTLTCERQIGDSFFQIKMASLPESRLVRVFLNDVTDLKRAEVALALARDKALEASRLKSEFLANVSHEVRTPLVGILGMIEFLEAAKLSAPQNAYVSTLRESADALITILDDILDLSKIEAGQLEVAETDFELGPMVQSAASLLAPKAHNKGLTLDTYLDPALPEWHRGDPFRLRQILLNLISNAIKFTDYGGILVRADRVETGPSGQPELRLSVRDTGTGISPDAQQRLFRPFVQVDGSASRRHGGTGLGLAISKRLVELLGGRIGLMSREAAGSTFWVDIPLVPGTGSGTPTGPAVEAGLRSSGPPEEKAKRKTPAPKRSAAPLRILVAEDHPVNQLVILRQLERLGHSVGLVSDGESALAALDVEPFDLVLMDCQMPGMDGYETTRAIRSRELESTGHIPIVAMTAGARREDREACLAAGMDEFLSKPVSGIQIAGVIEALVGAGKPRGAAARPPADYRPFMRLRRLLEPDERGIRAVLLAFRASLEEVVPAARSALAAQDPDRLRSLAHRLKGTCANVGADAMSAIAKRLEVAASKRAWERAEACVRDLDTERAAIQLALETELAGGKGREAPVG